MEQERIYKVNFTLEQTVIGSSDLGNLVQCNEFRFETKATHALEAQQKAIEVCTKVFGKESTDNVVFLDIQMH